MDPREHRLLLGAVLMGALGLAATLAPDEAWWRGPLLVAALCVAMLTVIALIASVPFVRNIIIDARKRADRRRKAKRASSWQARHSWTVLRPVGAPAHGAITLDLTLGTVPWGRCDPPPPGLMCVVARGGLTWRATFLDSAPGGTTWTEFPSHFVPVGHDGVALLAEGRYEVRWWRDGRCLSRSVFRINAEGYPTRSVIGRRWSRLVRYVTRMRAGDDDSVTYG